MWAKADDAWVCIITGIAFKRGIKDDVHGSAVRIIP
jgi:hypothetical protein